MTDENEPPKIRVIWEESSCSPAHNVGGLDTVVAGAKILYKEKEFFWWKYQYSKDHDSDETN